MPPYVKKTVAKRTYKPRKYRRSIYKRRARIYRPQRIGGFPKTRFAKLRYCEEFSLNVGAGLITSYVFRANDCFDPDATGTGHQPIGFDNMMAAYDHFTVLGAKIKLVNMASVTTNANPCYFGVLLSDDGTRATSASNVNHLMEYPGQLMSQGGGGYIWTRGDKQGNTLMRKFSTKKFFGLKDSVIGKADYRGSATASPAEQAFFECWVASIQGNDPGVCEFRVVIDYLVIFTEPKPISQS